MIDRLLDRIKEEPQTIFYGVVGFLILSYLLILVIDVFNLFGLRQALLGEEPEAFFWLYWFDVPVELPMQWLLLACLAATLFMSAGVAYGRRAQEAFDFSLLFAVGAILMLLEDHSEVRHFLRMQLEGDAGGADGLYGTLGTMVELMYFATLGGLLLFVFLRFRKLFWDLPQVRKFMLIGYGMYGLAAGSSWLGSAFRDNTESFRDLYSLVGQFFMDLLFVTGGETEKLYHRIEASFAEANDHPLGYYFMDRVYEESVELLGASALLVAAMLFLKAQRDGLPHQADGEADGNK